MRLLPRTCGFVLRRSFFVERWLGCSCLLWGVALSGWCDLDCCPNQDTARLVLPSALSLLSHRSERVNLG